MSSRSSIHSFSRLTVGLLALLAVACASAPKPVTLEDAQEISATVEAVDVNTRNLTIRGAEGDAFALRIGSSVRNLDEIRVGDRVVTRYYTSFAAELRRRGDGSGETQEPVVETAEGRAASGRPAGIVSTKTKRTVRVTGVNNTNHVVSFYGSDGIARSMPVHTPQGRAFIRKLKVGDEVEVTYTEAVAVSVEPAT